MKKNYKGSRLNLLYSLIYLVGAILLILIKVKGNYDNSPTGVIIIYTFIFILVSLSFIKSYFLCLSIEEDKVQLIGVFLKTEILIKDIKSIESNKNKNEIIIDMNDSTRHHINLSDINGRSRVEVEDILLSINLKKI